MDTTDASNAEPLDLLIIGAGIGGVIALHYARKAGLYVLLLERQSVVGGLWAELPAWQDIQFGRHDWTLGDLPIAGEDQASIRDNIQSWVDRFDLAEAMHGRLEYHGIALARVPQPVIALWRQLCLRGLP